MNETRQNSSLPVRLIGQAGALVRQRLSFLKRSGNPGQKDTESQAIDEHDEGVLDEAAFEADDIHYCMNCSAPLNGAFCYKCGQHDRELRRPIWALMLESLDAVIAFDSRVLRTLFPLVLMPGYVTRQYNEGKRSRYVPPVRLYLISTIVFFLTLAVANVAIVKLEFFPPDTGDTAADAPAEAASTTLAASTAGNAGSSAPAEEAQVGESGDGQSTEETENGQSGESDVQFGDVDLDVRFEMFADADPSPGAVPLPEDALSDAIRNIEESQQEVLAEIENSEEEKQLTLAILNFVQRTLIGMQRVTEDPRALNQTLNIWLPRVMIVMLPIFALLMRGLYWARHHYLFNMLVFSLHFHAYIFIVMTLFVVAQVGLGPTVSAWMFAAAVPIYLFVGMKVMSGQGWFRTSFKFILLSLVYGLLLFLTLTGTFIYGLSEI